MITLSNSTAVTVAAGAAVPLDYVVSRSGTCECHRRSSSSVKLCKRGSYLASYSATVSGTSGEEVSLAMALGNEVLSYTERGAVVTTTITTQTLANTISIDVGCCDFNRLTLVNTSTSPITIPAFGVTLAVCKPCS